MQFFKSLYINNLFYYVGIGIIVVMVLGFFFSFFMLVAWLALFALGCFLALDIILLYGMKQGVEATRTMADKLSNGDDNMIYLALKNNYGFKVKTEIIDEIPAQFQKRDFLLSQSLEIRGSVHLNYLLRPVGRGEYWFGALNIYTISPISLIKRRYRFDSNHMAAVYPSLIHLKKYDLNMFVNNPQYLGIKKIRRLGSSMEFEKIKEYVDGDDLRRLNWKATSKTNKLMVNQYQDERSQQVYCVIDKGRVMKMPFNGLSLLDYAINSTLVISGIVLKKQDRAGIFSFSKKTDNRVAAESRTGQMNKILENLYNVKTDFFESDFSRLYIDIKRNITHRSLIFLYTNFETLDGLYRQLNYLKAIAKNHLLVVIFFNNTELNQLINRKAGNLQEIFDKTIAEKFAFEKKLIANELKKYGIHCILTQPENLTIDSINKYLEIKSKGLI